MTPVQSRSRRESTNPSRPPRARPTYAPLDDMTLTFWMLDDDELVSGETAVPLVLGEGVTRPWKHGMPAGPVLVPVSDGAVEREDGILAVLVVVPGGGATAPSPSAVVARVNGAGAPAGMHLLRHADRIEVGRTVYWVSSAGIPREQAYDPAVHGEDVFCFLSKVRFAPGDALVACPGTPQRPCGMLISKRALEAGLTCHACGWNPDAPAWRPTPPRRAPAGSAADRLRARARARAERKEVRA